jgi:hypothetical protein
VDDKSRLGVLGCDGVSTGDEDSQRSVHPSLRRQRGIPTTPELQGQTPPRQKAWIIGWPFYLLGASGSEKTFVYLCYRCMALLDERLSSSARVRIQKVTPGFLCGSTRLRKSSSINCCVLYSYVLYATSTCSCPTIHLKNLTTRGANHLSPLHLRSDSQAVNYSFRSFLCAHLRLLMIDKLGM